MTHPTTKTTPTLCRLVRKSANTGAPGRTRTCDPRLRRPVLYPPELRARVVDKHQCRDDLRASVRFAWCRGR
jgi:hypothetical protein